MKKLVSLLCAFCLILTVHSVSVVAESTEDTQREILDSGQCGEKLYWELDSEGLLRIFGEGPMYDYNKYYEPSPWYKYREEPYISEDGTSILDKNGQEYLSTIKYYNDNPNGFKVKEILIEDGVTYIGDWAFYRVCVEEIVVPETVEAVGIFCFRYSPTLRNLVLPDSLKFLDDYAISRNYELESIRIGNSLETVGTAGFNNNPSLKEIILPETCTSINKQQSPTYANIDYSKVGLMENCTSLESVSFGSVTDIPQRTCLYTAIKTVEIPNTVQSIGEYAFFSCNKLERVAFEEGSVCKTIENNAFTYCSALKSVTGGTALEKLGVYTELSNLEEFDFSVTNKELQKGQFLGTSIKEITVSDNITVIPVSCFNSMKMLEKIYLPGTITEIMASSFNYCESLKDIYFDGTLTQWYSIKKASGWNYKISSECMLHLKDGTSVSLWHTPTKYTVSFVDFDGTVLSTQKVIVGLDAVEPEVPEREGYIFAGWSRSFTNIQEDIVVTAEYTKKEVVISTGILRVDVTGGTGFTISVNGSNARPQGANYYNSKIQVGSEVTVTAKGNSGATFLGWINPANGKVVSDDYSYSFITSGNDTIKAMFSTDVEGVQMVMFKNDKSNQYLDIQYYAAEDEINFPDTPSQVGFDFAGWNVTEEEIKAAIAKGEDVTVTAEWTRQIVPVQVTVNGGSGTGQYNANSAVTVVANEAPEGQKFAYWTDTEGNIKCYTEEYKFYPSEDTEVTAVFVSEDTAVEETILVSVDTTTPDATGAKTVIYYSWYIPAEYDAVGVGILAIDSKLYNEETFYVGTTDTNVVRRGPDGTDISHVDTYTWTKAIPVGDTWYAKAYVQYKDSAGEVITVYSELFEVTKE